MRCIVCAEFSFGMICKNCLKELSPKLHKRELKEDFYVYSFFAYNDISPLLHTKHHPCGASIYKQLSKMTLKPFLQSLKFDEKVSLLPIDDRIKNGYSHTAVLAHFCKNRNFIPRYKALRAKNSISYSGKSLQYRKTHKRDFSCGYAKSEDVILIDDLVTTGITLLEACRVLEKENKNILFALTLADAKNR